MGKKLAKATWEEREREMPQVANEIRDAPTASLASSTPRGGQHGAGKRRAARGSVFPSLSNGVGGDGGEGAPAQARRLDLPVLIHGGGGGRLRSPSLLSMEGSAAGAAQRRSRGCRLWQQQRLAAGLSSLRRGTQDDVQIVEFALDRQKNKTGDILHVSVECTTLVSGRKYFGLEEDKPSQLFGTYDFDSSPFDRGDDYKLPNFPETDLVIYEMNVRAFTADESSRLGPSVRGSYLGVIDKIPHLLELGINAMELLPVFEFDELEFKRFPNPRDHMMYTHKMDWRFDSAAITAPPYARIDGDASGGSRMCGAVSQ
ncbi:unnamed protein product [Urochloa humidicola]